MKLSTKSRYAVMAMVELAESGHIDHPLTLTEISVRQHLPVQYIEQLFLKLRKAGLVQSIRGQSGGYYLNRPATSINIAEIIAAVGEEVRATGCEALSEKSCRGTKTRCLTHNLWSGLGQVMNNYLQAVTLDDVVHQRITGQGKIMMRNLHSSEMVAHI
jgi:Rrf2 family iron-sulfur cluster assembly transcriptional regulator